MTILTKEIFLKALGQMNKNNRSWKLNKKVLYILEKITEDVVKYSVKTCHPYFFNQVTKIKSLIIQNI